VDHKDRGTTLPGGGMTTFGGGTGGGMAISGGGTPNKPNQSVLARSG